VLASRERLPGMRRRVSVAWVVISALLALLSLPSLPADVAGWASWLSWVADAPWRWALPMIGWVSLVAAIAALAHRDYKQGREQARAQATKEGVLQQLGRQRSQRTHAGLVAPPERPVVQAAARDLMKDMGLMPTWWRRALERLRSH